MKRALQDIYSRIPIEKLKNRGYSTRVVVVDGGSTDNTVSIAKSWVARLSSNGEKVRAQECVKDSRSSSRLATMNWLCWIAMARTIQKKSLDSRFNSQNGIVIGDRCMAIYTLMR